MRFPNFRGVVPALTTPFRKDFSLDDDGFARLVDCVISDGVDGLLVNGCTGESWSLTAEERFVVFQTAVEVAGGRVPVIAGCSAITAAEVIGKVRQAEKAGCTYAMVSPPWYVMPGPAEIAAHYEQVLAATEIPILLYNIPAVPASSFRSI
ncbi:MAG: dihydrodipicolinate synthase family protein [Acetobacteraceae bacterium]|nr:dihydrodipicolinate synthase family protein [Acetobacteraceae bacterium]